MNKTQLILLGIAFACAFGCLVMATIISCLNDIVKEIRNLREELSSFKNIEMNISDNLIDKVFSRFEKANKSKSNERTDR